MKICVLGSGSKGNAVLIRSGTTRILLDAGLSTLAIKKRLAAVGEDIAKLDAILISHEHVDHVRALPVLTGPRGPFRDKAVPVFMTRACASAVLYGREVEGIEHFEAGEELEIDSLRVRSFSVPHDASDPVGFVIEDGRHRIGVVTDLGTATRLVQERLRDLSALIIESNHDPDMLKNGPYAWELKQRILSRIGHLANQDSAALVAEVYHRGLRHVLLAHLSEQNNTPALAHAAAGEVLDSTATRLHVTCQDRPSELINL